MNRGDRTLTPHIHAYVTGRRSRGEITATTAADIAHTLAGLDRTFGRRPLSQLGPAAIDRYREHIAHRADATRREYLSRVRCFCRWLVAQGLIACDPTEHVPPIRQPKTVPVTLTEAQVATLLRTVAHDRRATAIAWLMVGCGARCGEVAALRIEDYDPVGLTVLLVGKNSDQRVVPVPRVVARALNAYLDQTGCASGPLIRSELNPSRGLTAKTISGYMRGWLREAGVKVRAHDGRSAHGLRRTAASDVMDFCGDIRAVQAMLGHRHVETTARHYLRPISLEAMREAMEGRRYDHGEEDGGGEVVYLNAA